MQYQDLFSLKKQRKNIYACCLLQSRLAPNGFNALCNWKQMHAKYFRVIKFWNSYFVHSKVKHRV